MQTRDVGAALRETVGRSAVFTGVGRAAALGEEFAELSLSVDCLGVAIPMAIGFAVATKGEVRTVAIDGDGSSLFDLSWIATAASAISAVPQLRKQLLVVVVDNGLYESGGGLASGSRQVDWESLYHAFGLTCSVVTNLTELSEALRTPPSIVHALVEDSRAPERPHSRLNGIERVAKFRCDVENRIGISRPYPAFKY